jgi:hypothetical protein
MLQRAGRWREGTFAAARLRSLDSGQLAGQRTLARGAAFHRAAAPHPPPPRRAAAERHALEVMLRGSTAAALPTSSGGISTMRSAGSRRAGTCAARPAHRPAPVLARGECGGERASLFDAWSVTASAPSHTMRAWERGSGAPRPPPATPGPPPRPAPPPPHGPRAAAGPRPPARAARARCAGLPAPRRAPCRSSRASRSSRCAR